MDTEVNQDTKTKEPVNQKLGTVVLIVFSSLIIIAIASYYFNIELTDLT